MDKKFNLLVVEDDDKTFEVLKGGLSAVDYKIWRVTTGKEALKLAKDVYFTVVITEVRIPDMRGTELIKKIKKMDYKINVIVLSTYSFVESAVEAMKKGAYTYLLKPLNVEEVNLVLRRAIRNVCLMIQAGKRKYYQDMSVLDGLTGVYNHRYFHEKLEWHVDHLKRFPQTFSMFIIDIDNFKKYNDTNGHLEGDKVLHDAAQLFVSSTRDNDVTCRYGGEEFTVILPQTGREHALLVGERMVEAVRKRLPITISVGLAVFPDNAQTKNDLINNADKALFRAKRLGKDRLCLYDEKVDV